MTTTTFASSLARPFLLALCVAALGLATTGCSDLGRCARGTDACACREDSNPSDSVDDRCDNDAEGNPMICGAGFCYDRVAYDAPTVCYNACAYNNGGTCDDGQEGSTSSLCAYGSDCSDCGARPNPCPANQPVFCPQDFGIVGVDQCWPAGTECRTLRTCSALASVGPYFCQTGEIVDCGNGGACRAKPVCGNANPIYVPCYSENACPREFTNCNALSDCPAGSGSRATCYYSETLICGATGPSCQGN